MYFLEHILFSTLRDFPQVGFLWRWRQMGDSSAFSTFTLREQARHDGTTDRRDVRIDSRQCNTNNKHGKMPDKQTNKNNSILQPLEMRPSVPSRTCGERLPPVCGGIFVSGTRASPQLTMRLQNVEMQRPNVLPHMLVLWEFRSRCSDVVRAFDLLPKV